MKPVHPSIVLAAFACLLTACQADRSPDVAETCQAPEPRSRVVELTIDRSHELVQTYHTAQPPNELFLSISEARHVGDVAGYALLYYDFAWGTNESSRGTQKLIVFDADNSYLGYYYLGGPLETQKCEIIGRRVTIVFIDDDNDPSDDTHTLDFSNGIPNASVQGELRFHADR